MSCMHGGRSGIVLYLRSCFAAVEIQRYATPHPDFRACAAEYTLRKVVAAMPDMSAASNTPFLRCYVNMHTEATESKNSKRRHTYLVH